ncbi:MAG: hypothetical protein JXB00_18720 [Bacteroidales bacterium]|nr:hypothetical protein [Bacteroidales bacterium]
MKKIRLIYIFLPLMLAFTCEQKEDKLISDVENKITGEWIWVKSTYYNTNSGLPFVLSPDSVGYTVRQLFSTDGTYLQFKNDIIESSGIYWLETVPIKDNTETEVRLFSQKEDYVNFVKLSITGDSLILDNTLGDGTLKLFRRILGE